MSMNSSVVAVLERPSECPSDPLSDIRSLAHTAVLSLASPSSRRNYAREIARYIATGLPLNREGVQAHMIALREAGAGAVTRNVALAAIRLLANEANARGLISDSEFGAIEHVKGAKVLGSKTGNWLDVQGVRLLVHSARQRAHGVRDAAILACMCGCGLRRAEICGLTWGQWRQLDGRFVWADIEGKGGRVRTVPVPRWVARYVEEWKAEGTDSAEANTGSRVFPITPQNIYLIVQESARAAGLGDIAPHDLRRTCARLMRNGDASLEQIQQILGHASVQTTERYLGTKLELREGRAATDRIQFDGAEGEEEGEGEGK